MAFPTREGIRFDVPYTMVPETGLLNQQCDEFSGIVERDKRQYWSVPRAPSEWRNGLGTLDFPILPEAVTAICAG